MGLVPADGSEECFFFADIGISNTSNDFEVLSVVFVPEVKRETRPGLLQTRRAFCLVVPAAGFESLVQQAPLELIFFFVPRQLLLLLPSAARTGVVN